MYSLIELLCYIDFGESLKVQIIMSYLKIHLTQSNYDAQILFTTSKIKKSFKSCKKKLFLNTITQSICRLIHNSHLENLSFNKPCDL